MSCFYLHLPVYMSCNYKFFQGQNKMSFFSFSLPHHPINLDFGGSLDQFVYIPVFCYNIIVGEIEGASGLRS